MQALRHALGRRGGKTSMRGFARELGMSPQGYRYWEKPGSYPGHTKLVAALTKVDALKTHKLDPVRLAVWLETGGGPEPWLATASPSVIPSPSSARHPKIAVPAPGEVDHFTPWRLLVTLATLSREGKQDEVLELLRILGPVAAGVLLCGENTSPLKATGPSRAMKRARRVEPSE